MCLGAGEMMENFSISFILFLSYFSFLPVSLLLSSATADSIKQHGSIKDGETITSDGAIFELGFFSPNNSDNRYVGIWYHKIPIRTIVWVANRENPLTDFSGVLTIGGDGNLVILDGRNITVWSTNASISVNSTAATLWDSGNLVLKDGTSNNSSNIFWQSFDHPTDTLLPGMKIGIDLVARRNRMIQSWKSANNPSPGNFSFRLDPKDSNQFFIFNNSAPYWRSGYWNERVFNQPPVVSTDFLFHFNTISNEEGIYLEYSSLYNNTKLVMDVSGQVQCRIWLDEAQIWSLAWVQPKDQCGRYAVCGQNSRCSDYNTRMCECLDGFEPVSPTEWNSGTWSGGCKRRKALECGNGDSFLSLGKLKVPDHELLVGKVGTDEDCGVKCLSNCSCIAYAFANVSNEGGYQCLVWSGDLMDIGDLKESHGAQDIYLKVAPSELGTNNHKKLAVIVAVPVVAGIVVLGSLFCCLRRILRKKGNNEGMPPFGSSDTSILCGSEFLDTSKLAQDGQKWTDIPFFEFSTLAAATNNFSRSDMLGEGGFGPVYKGKLPGGQEIAVKRLSRCSGQGLEEFETEVKLIAKLQHRNLVRLLGYGIQGYEKMLIYEYMPNKSLDWFLFDKDRSRMLDWEKRFNIILGIARGLLYLHQDSRLRIIHRDLKTSNVLLDEEMNPRISDFGLARIVGGNQTQECTKRVVGTYGYMSPEYASHGLFSVKSDVFSFGVILLEIISGMKSNNFIHSDESSSLPEHAWGLWKEGNALALVDPVIRGKCDIDEQLKCTHVGLLCVQEKAADRPTMASVVPMLVSEAATLPNPRQPAFIMRRDVSEIECSRNEMTFTKVEGR